MSRLSQFFSSGGQKIEFLLVGGGGGGGARGGRGGGRCTLGSGGGGGGQVVLGEDYEVRPGQSYPIIIGAGGVGGCTLPNPCIYPGSQPYYCCTHFDGSPGKNGGSSCFGSVFARGGGGGGGGILCTPCYLPIIPNLENKGCNGGSGGGGGGTGSYPFIPLTYSYSGGTGIGNYSIGNTIKFGNSGQTSWPVESLSSDPLATVSYTCIINFAGGGGGAGGGAASQGGGSNAGSVVLTGYNICSCGPYQYRTYLFQNFCGSVNLGSGGAGDNPVNAIFRKFPLGSHNHGVDGYLNNIEGTDQYYGGGGEAYQGQNCLNLDYTAVSSSAPYYPSLTCPRNRCPGGGLGGGAYWLRTGCAPVVNIGSCCGFWYNCVYGCASYACPVSCYTLYAAPSGSGGGGASSARGYVNSTTGPCSCNPCIGDGTNGASGVLIIRYPTAYNAATVSGNTPVTPIPGYYIYKWTGPGSITFNN